MYTKQIIFAIAIIILVVASIIVGNLFFSQILGVDVDSLPPFLKFLVHSAGAAAVGYVTYKLFRRR
jgi:hypothetical protein